MRKNHPFIMALAAVLLAATGNMEAQAQKSGNVSAIINNDKNGQKWLLLKLDDEQSRLKLPELAINETITVKNGAGIAFTFSRDTAGLTLKLPSGKVIKLPSAGKPLDKEALRRRILEKREARRQQRSS